MTSCKTISLDSENTSIKTSVCSNDGNSTYLWCDFYDVKGVYPQESSLKFKTTPHSFGVYSIKEVPNQVPIKFRSGPMKYPIMYCNKTGKLLLTTAAFEYITTVANEVITPNGNAVAFVNVGGLRIDIAWKYTTVCSLLHKVLDAVAENIGTRGNDFESLKRISEQYQELAGMLDSNVFAIQASRSLANSSVRFSFRGVDGIEKVGGAWMELDDSTLRAFPAFMSAAASLGFYTPSAVPLSVRGSIVASLIQEELRIHKNFNNILKSIPRVKASEADSNLQVIQGLL